MNAVVNITSIRKWKAPLISDVPNFVFSAEVWMKGDTTGTVTPVGDVIPKEAFGLFHYSLVYI